ncbi:CATRA system-associated protein [Streptomyces sp. SID3343]|uniref:CATRA system-associated protein n=1 Tax=Streptomyces sp. SID3343 TaxID=2690260 RepID=UPI00136B3CA1|nr:CATRA system-associated protein [Streptomyces sp. SID3343]MYV97757.1 hypothetical protein [Streptomyces sp. SID3343]
MNGYCEESVEVLREALIWRLDTDRWTRVEQLLQSVDAALKAGDACGFRHAVHSLEAAGPERVAGLEAANAAMPAPAPAAVRVRIDRLVHTLESAGLPGTSNRAGAEQDDGRHGEGRDDVGTTRR